MSQNASALDIRTARLQLREFTLADAEHMYLLESIPEVVRYQTWEPRSREEAARVVREVVDGQHKTPRGVVELAVIETKDGRFIGRVGGCIDHKSHEASLWFSFMPASQGQGFASEAMQALIPVLHQTFSVRQCEIECDPRNHGSRNLALRLGFSKVKEVQDAFECKGESVGSAVFVKQLDPEQHRPST